MTSTFDVGEAHVEDTVPDRDSEAENHEEGNDPYLDSNLDLRGLYICPRDLDMDHLVHNRHAEDSREVRVKVVVGIHTVLEI